MMNLYITNKDLSNSARDLDDARIKLQFEYLATAINIAIQRDDTCMEILKDYEIAFKYKLQGKSWRSSLLPIRKYEVNHSMIEWVGKSPLTLILSIVYLGSLYNEIRWRSMYISSQLDNFFIMVNYLNAVYLRIIPTKGLDTSYGLSTALYKNVPKEYDDKNSIIAYQKYLISHWKTDALKLHKYRIATGEWKVAFDAGNSTLKEKPRAVRPTKWSGRHIPDFAIKELSDYQQSLINKE